MNEANYTFNRRAFLQASKGRKISELERLLADLEKAEREFNAWKEEHAR
jgi:hypothetical protein